MIDAHCHFWTLSRGDYGWLEGEGGPLGPIRRDFGPADYPGAGRVIAVQAAPTVAETDHLLALAAAEPRIAGVVGWADLAAPDAPQVLARLAAQPVLKGIRPMLQDIPDTDWLARAARPEAIAAMERLGLRFDALVTARHLPMLAAFAADHPRLPLVIDHAAKPQPGGLEDWARDMAALAALPQVHCKLSGLMTELPRAAIPDVVDQLLALFGPGRLIWGSDWPVLTLAADYADWLALSESLVPAQHHAAVMGGNAARFYGVAP